MRFLAEFSLEEKLSDIVTNYKAEYVCKDLVSVIRSKIESERADNGSGRDLTDEEIAEWEQFANKLQS